MSTQTPSYDESAIKVRLSAVPPSKQVIFAASCAEHLIPLYDLFVSRTGQGDVDLLRVALDLAWEVASEASFQAAAVDARRDEVESLVPSDEDEDWTLLSPIAQNAAASVAYSLRAAISRDPQDAVWAARQLYEVADFLVQLTASEHAYVQPTDEDAPVAIALAGIKSALDNLELQSPLDDLKMAAIAGGERLRALVQESGEA